MKYESYTVIFLNHKNGNIFELLIDTEDLERVINFKYRWYAKKYVEIVGYYVVSTVYLGMIDGKFRNKMLLLHRFLMDAKDDEVVDHENHNTLDCRKSNMRITNDLYNTKHRDGANSNNTSGHRNVSFIHKHYRVQLQINGKNYMFPEHFDDPNEAGIFAEAMRLKYYGEFEGKG